MGGSLRSGRHVSFMPRVTLARQIAATGKVSAMIDISDGLSRDLRQICNASTVSALIQASLIPVHPDADGIDAALHDGEDHELLFTAAPELTHPSCLRIGDIVPNESGGPNVYIVRDGQRVELSQCGWTARW
jgi:thiamine-monophosphate kinase